MFEDSIGFLTNSEKSLISERAGSEVDEDSDERRHLLDDHEDETATDMADNITQEDESTMVSVSS